MEYLITAVILYFVLQTAGNLVYILRGGGASSSDSGSSPEPASPPPGWGGPSPRRETEGITDHPTFWGEDIEEATWRDLKE